MADYDTAAAPTSAEQVEWWNLWGKLKAAANDMDAAVARLQSQRDFALSRPPLRAEFEKKLADIESARSKVVWARDAIRNTLGKLGINLQGMTNEGLGLIWIPIAAVAAGVAYVAKLAADAWELSKRIEEQRRLEAKGMNPAEAAAVVAQSTAAQSSIAQAAKWIAIAAGVSLAAYWIIRRHA